VIELLLADAADVSQRIELDVTGVTHARTVAAELLRVVGRHLGDRGIDVVLDGDLG